MSSNEWRIVKLSEIAQPVRNLYTPKPGDGFPYIGLEHIEQQTLRLSGLGSSDDVISQKSKFGKKDILFGKLRPYFRKVYMAEFDGVCSTDILVLRPQKNVDHNYLFYFLANQKFIDKASGGSSGTRMPRADWAHLANTEWEIPNYTTQVIMGKMLRSLDEKIELNRQMNATLEAMAQAIFKEWFVDFNYPGATGDLIDSPLGPIPRGWEVCQLSVVVDIVDCLHTKKPDRQEINTGNILLQLENILDNGLIDLHKKYWITDVDYMLWTSRIEVKEGDIVITNVGRVGALARIPAGFLGALGRNMTSLRAKNNFLFTYFLILLLKSEQMRNEIDLKTDPGTILNSLNVKNIPLLRFIHPPAEIVIEFEQTIKYLWVHMDRNMQEIIQLETLRDLLLPKLMAGEIELS